MWSAPALLAVAPLAAALLLLHQPPLARGLAFSPTHRGDRLWDTWLRTLRRRCRPAGCSAAWPPGSSAAASAGCRLDEIASLT